MNRTLVLNVVGMTPALLPMRRTSLPWQSGGRYGRCVR